MKLCKHVKTHRDHKLVKHADIVSLPHAAARSLDELFAYEGDISILCFWEDEASFDKWQKLLISFSMSRQ